MCYSLIMANTNNSKMTLKSRTNMTVDISRAYDSRIVSVVDSDGVALVTARSAKARDELMSEYEAWGLKVDACDKRGLKAWA